MIEFLIFYWIFSAIVVVVDLCKEAKCEDGAIIEDYKDFTVLILVIVFSGILLPIFIGITMADVDSIRNRIR